MAQEKNFYLVAIGASAGGLEAIESFFSKVPANSGLAFVIIQHLSPDYKSLMPEILLKRTSLPVYTAEDGMAVEPNNIYLIPRKMNMKVFHSRLHLTEKDALQSLSLPIDIFFNSLAEDFDDKAIGVILSGTGSDGSRGIRAIKENGGIVVAQEPESAKFDGMPKSAISTGIVDFILPPGQMPEKLIGYVKHPYIISKKNSEEAIVPDDYLSKIILILKEEFGLDFTYYKDTTISRRIERRLSINQMDNLKDYLNYLRTSKTEQSTLYKELLIGVTKFFRDGEAFSIIENEIIPRIFEGKSENDEVRAWISACSTGEEAYSIAILLKEYMKKHNLKNDVKCFATDIDKNSIEYASNGVYNASIIADVSPERLAKYFIQMGDSFKIIDEIREMIVFATHNLIKDPPFNKIDLLSCRNFLIYLQQPMQQRVISLFNFAINKSGYLFLGSSESIGEMEQYFDSVNIKWKIFKSNRTLKFPADIVPKNPKALIVNKFQGAKPAYSLVNSTSNLENFFTEKILADNAPDTIIVNENLQIVNTFGDMNKYLVFPKNQKISEGFEYIITKMVPSNIKLTFSLSVNKAFKNDEIVEHRQVKYEKNPKEPLIVDIRFVPVTSQDILGKFVLIYIRKSCISSVEPIETTAYEDIGQQAQQYIHNLENELKHTKENLQASIEELETTNEELQSTNEELISANEELQSTNEELQSVNEELYTVNTEFQAKNHDLVVINNDMENLIQHFEIRIIFLDLDLKIRKYTDHVSEIMNLKTNDIGRPISDITHHIADTDIYTKAKKVIKDHQQIQKIVRVKTRWFQMKILPYMTQKGIMDGIVITFIDLSDFYHVQAELKESEDKFKKIIEVGMDAVYMLKAKHNSKGEIVDFTFTDINHNAEKQMGMSSEDMIGKDICELFPINRTEGYFDKYKKVMETSVPHEEEYYILPGNPASGWYYHQVMPIGDGVAIFNRDITSRKLIELELQKTTTLYRSLFENMGKAFAFHEIILDNKGKPVDYRFIDVNSNFESITGLKKKNIIGKRLLEIMPDTEKDWITRYGEVALTGQAIDFEMESKVLGKKFRVNAYSPEKGKFACLFDAI